MASGNLGTAAQPGDAQGPQAHCARQLEGGIRRLWVLLRLETKGISLKNLASFLTPKSCQMFFFDAILNE